VTVLGAGRVCRPAPPYVKEIRMRAINQITLLLLIVGGLNWGLVGLFEFDLVAALLFLCSLCWYIV
jgi:uncharacterized membrane protein YuzA (DUF378 family)